MSLPTPLAGQREIAGVAGESLSLGGGVNSCQSRGKRWNEILLSSVLQYMITLLFEFYCHCTACVCVCGLIITNISISHACQYGLNEEGPVKHTETAL